MLDDTAQSSFLPMLSASKNPQTLYLSSPPDETSEGEVFRRIRETALSGKSENTSWNEWGVSEIGDVSDRERWAKVIPSLGYLIREDTVKSELEQLSPDKFARERLGWWSNTSAGAVIKESAWNKCKTDSPPQDGIKTFAVKFSPDGAIGSLAVCLRPENGAPYVEVIANRGMADGLAWFDDFLTERWESAAQIVVDGMSNAQPLIDRLRANGVPQRVLIKPTSSEMQAACSTMLNAVNSCEVEHMGQPALDKSATGSTKRPIGSNGGWGFKSNQDADSTLIEAASLALWSALNTKRNPARKARIA